MTDSTDTTHARSSDRTDSARALEWLQDHASNDTRQAMASRYGIPTENAYGVSMAHMKVLGKQLGLDHDLAGALWATGIYEARVVASLVDEPARVTSRQMDAWCRDFDSWAVCDTVCFNLFDRAPHAWQKIDPWSRRPEEFVKRGAFALLWSLALHDRTTADRPFVDALQLAEREAVDDRPMVTKAITMALYAVGRRNATLHAAASATAKRLSESATASARVVGRSAASRLTRRGRQS